MKGNSKIRNSYPKVMLAMGIASILCFLLQSRFETTEKSPVELKKGLEHWNTRSISLREFVTSTETQGCRRLSSHGYDEAPLRVFIYQKKGGQQLVDLLLYYLKALTYDEIVVIANEEGDDVLSEPFYKKLVSNGAHFWQCSGTLLFKGDRWTEVMLQYKDNTDFLLPIDVDEYLAIDSSDENAPALTWNRSSLLSALKELPPSGGKPYKTLDAKPVPVDCEDHPDGLVLDFETKYTARHCLIAGVTVGHEGCFAKNFFEGKEFVGVDNGNHHGPKVKAQELRQLCETEGLEAHYIRTNFVLVHYQYLDFRDWMTHLFKRAIDYEYETDCTKPNPDLPYHHVCNLYSMSKATNFSVHAMQEIYNDLVCHATGVHYDSSGITSLPC